MSVDCSRFTFNAWHDFLGVVMQQGRVQLDADWNEFVAQMIRRVQVGALDTFEKTVVPRTTPDGFRIQANAGQLTIGAGRIYVDGILAENHGGGALQWDARLAELTGGTPVNYNAQPYYPAPPALPAGGPHLVYLDVWQREVTWLQQPELVEKAVGVDTTARWQVVWQVKVLPQIGSAQCGSPDADVPGWTDATRPSAGRLTTATGAAAISPDPCKIPPSGGYKGLENQLYRIEIHDGGGIGAATFKWSRDNRSVQSPVRQINAARDRVVVDSTGRDAVLHFADGDWVEIIDDVQELHGEPGIVRRIALSGGVSDDTRTIVLTQPLPAGVFPTGAQDDTDPARHTRIRRWNQSGKILREDGTLYHDLGLAAATGVIPVPPAGTRLLVEDGILASFDLAAGGGGFRVGDHWCFAARAADASIELLDRAPPLGIHHHYARLAIVNFPDVEHDCRVFWPPEAAAGHDCACDACVTVEGHAAGTATIQQAIDSLAERGGMICLGAGIYRLREPLHIANAGALTLRGKGWRTLLVPEQAGVVIEVSDSVTVSLEDFAAIGAVADNPDVEGAGQGLIAVRDTVEFTADHLYLIATSPGDTRSAAFSLDGYLLGAAIRQCAIIADVGIVGGVEKDKLLLAAEFDMNGNLLVCRDAGIGLGKRTLHIGQTNVARNLMLASTQMAVLATGAAPPGASLCIAANTLSVAGDGIVAGVDGLHIVDNHVQQDGNPAQGFGGNGIVLAPGLDPEGIGHVWITGNQIDGMRGAGIAVQVPVGAAIVKQNVIERTYSGIVFVDKGAGTHVSIDNNQLLDIGADHNPPGVSVVGIEVVWAQHVDIVGNAIRGFARNALQASDRAAIRAVASADVRIAGNRLDQLGPVQPHGGYVAGIEIHPPYAHAMIDENGIARGDDKDVAMSFWQAIRIGQLAEQAVLTAAGAIVLAGKEVSYVLTRKALRAVAVEPARDLSIRANQGSAWMLGAPLVTALRPASLIFADNHFEAVPDRNTTTGAPLVVLNGDSVIVSSNRLRWIGSEQAAMNLVDVKAFTVLGNIASGSITADGGPLPGPWLPLNVFGFA
jgi:hypothetical protein